jgi:hypothetical protein
MPIESILENRVYEYAYVSNGKKYSGKGKVVEKVKKVNGWRAILEDKVRNKTITLYPSQVTKAARTR